MTEHSNHGSVVWRYSELNKKYNSPHFLDRLTAISTLIVQPIGHIFFWITFFGFPSIYVYFGGELHPPWYRILLYIVSSLQIIWSCYGAWIEVIEYHQLSTTLMIWKLLTLRLRVPTITIHSKDTEHQLFKWSAGASFLFNNI
jgi:hypothetical protein